MFAARIYDEAQFHKRDNDMKKPRLAAAVLFAVMNALNVSAAPQARSSSSTPLHFEAATVKPTRVLSGVRGHCHDPGVDLSNGAKYTLIPRGRCLIRSAT